MEELRNNEGELIISAHKTYKITFRNAARALLEMYWYESEELGKEALYNPWGLRGIRVKIARKINKADEKSSGEGGSITLRLTHKEAETFTEDMKGYAEGLVLDGRRGAPEYIRKAAWRFYNRMRALGFGEGEILPKRGKRRHFAKIEIEVPFESIIGGKIHVGRYKGSYVSFLYPQGQVKVIDYDPSWENIDDWVEAAHYFDVGLSSSVPGHVPTDAESWEIVESMLSGHYHEGFGRWRIEKY